MERDRFEPRMRTDPAFRMSVHGFVWDGRPKLPLSAFADEVMDLFNQVPTPKEILVQKVGFLRFAEAEGRFDETLVQLNDFVARVSGH